MEEYLACKSMLFTRCETGVVNLDDPAWEGVTQGHTCRLQTFGFSRQAELYAENEHLVTRPGFLGVGFTMKGRRDLDVEVDIPGHFNVYNALAAAAVCTLFDVPDEAIRRGLARVRSRGAWSLFRCGKLHAADRLCTQRCEHGEHSDDAAGIPPAPPDLSVRCGRQPAACPAL